MDFWFFLSVYVLAAAVILWKMPHVTSAKTIARRVRRYRRHHTVPHRWRKTDRRHSPRLRDRIARICAGVVFRAPAPLSEPTARWAGFSPPSSER